MCTYPLLTEVHVGTPRTAHRPRQQSCREHGASSDEGEGAGPEAWTDSPCGSIEAARPWVPTGVPGITTGLSFCIWKMGPISVLTSFQGWCL